jgi:hypothetical protein
MKKKLFGLTRRELLFIVTIASSSFMLIIYSSVKLIHTTNINDDTKYNEIHSQSKYLAYLNDLNSFTSAIQRNSLNLMVYKTNLTEVASLKKTIETNRDSVVLKLNSVGNINFTSIKEKTDLTQSCLNYLNANAAFLKMFNDSVSLANLTTYNLQKMRPAVQLFIDLIRKNSDNTVKKIQQANNNRLSFFDRIEFWLLLIGLAPYLYVFCRIITLIIRMILWESF